MKHIIFEIKTMTLRTTCDTAHNVEVAERVYVLLTDKTRHNELFHTCIIRMAHVVRSRNLIYLLRRSQRIQYPAESVLKTTHVSIGQHRESLIKTTRPFDRLNVNFKCSRESKSIIRYILNYN